MNCNWLFVRKGHLLFEENHDKVYFLMHKYGQNAQEIAMGCEKMETFHIQNTASSTARRMGAALARPTVFQHDGHGDLRVVGGRVPDEHRVDIVAAAR